ncbi:hypothetical protein [Actinoallomurus iriomotensis]|uniref:Uncharacterized protein n=1 Tax=Actinoallomurus iriomotensis TaxID=478107 RepID=A0A9W6S1M5_9ACTN|nr:hypothetical protein Airi02_047900 [Actinoallomurus iriomotensis]
MPPVASLSRASSMSSGRMPTTSERPMCSSSAGRSSSASGPTRNSCPPIRAFPYLAADIHGAHRDDDGRYWIECVTT